MNTSDVAICCRARKRPSGESLDDWLVGKDATGEIVACVSLLSYTPALAEVRSLAVDDRVKGEGWGRTILKAAIAEARQRQIPTLIRPDSGRSFFERGGFQISSRERFPEKVWRDCHLCPLQEHCDETAVVLHLSDPQAVSLPRFASRRPSHHAPRPIALPQSRHAPTCARWRKNT